MISALTLSFHQSMRINSHLRVFDGWIRNRQRYCIWHHWNRGRRTSSLPKGVTRENGKKNLIRLGVNPVMAFHWSRTRMGGWAVAQSPILGTTITLSRLPKRGYEDMLSHYGKIAPHLNEPLYANPP